MKTTAIITHTESNTTTISFYRGKQIFTYTDCESVIIEKCPWRSFLTVDIYSCIFLGVMRTHTRFDCDKVAFGEGMQLHFCAARACSVEHADVNRVTDAVDEYYQQWERADRKVSYVRVMQYRKLDSLEMLKA